MGALPLTSGQSLVRGAALVLSLVLFCACSPRLISSPPPSAPHDQIHDDPAHDAQASLLREAHRAFGQERYSTAVLFFRRYVDSAPPGAPQLAEARWWLGRSYERMGEYRVAMAEYRVLATSDAGDDSQAPLYQQQALQRLDQLRQIPGGSRVIVARQVALGLPLSRLPPVSMWVAWLQALLKGGITTVLLDPAGADWSQNGRISEAVQAFIGAAHLAGLSVWGAVDPHQGRGVPLRPEWLSQSFVQKADSLINPKPAGGQAKRPDPLHPAYQAAIEERAALLLRAGCDGILVRARETGGYAQDFTDESFQRFASAFGLTLAPQQLLAESVGGEAMVYDRETTYWRWVGWKSRGYATMAAHIRTLIRKAKPAGRLLMEVHGRTINEPLIGLEQYGEDLNDLFQRTGRDLVIRMEDATGSALVELLAQQVGSSDRLWRIQPVTVPEAMSFVEWTEKLDSISLEEGDGNLLLLPQTTGSLP